MEKTNDQVERILPTLYGIEKNGKIKQWSATIYRREDNTAYVLIQYGQSTGKQQTITREYTVGKNIGKKNETTPLEQCIAETIKKWEDKQTKQNYTPGKDISLNKLSSQEGIIRPMLASTYNPNKPKKVDIQFPCFVQPKLDGLRCVIYMRNGIIVCQSRTGGLFKTMDHIIDILKPLFNERPHLILDGELYTKDFPFEELAGLIKKKRITDSDKQRLKQVQYHVYDIVSDTPYRKRLETLVDIFTNYAHNFEDIILLVDTEECSHFTQFHKYFAKYVQNGFEGIMLRNCDSIYRQNYRSNDLQKYKEYEESEYPIVGYKEAEGRDKGTVIWICQTPEGRKFSVRPRGTYKMRHQWFQNANVYIGKRLTVIYQELSELNVPRFPVGKDIRDGY